MPLSMPLFAVMVFFSRAGVGLFFFINTWIVIHVSGSTSSAAISLMVAVLPSLFFSMLIVSFADHFSAVKLVFLSEQFRCLILFVYATVFMLWGATPFLAYMVSFFMAVCSEVQLMAWRVILATFSSGERNFKFNALSVSSGQAGVVVGATVSGVLFVTFGASTTVYINSVVFFISAALFFLLSRHLPCSTGLRKSKSIWGVLRYHADAMREGVCYAAQQPALMGCYLLILLNVSVLYISNALLAPFVKGPLQLDAESYGRIDAAYSMGAIVGGLIIVRLTFRLGGRRIALLGLSILALSLFLFAYSNSFLMAFLAYFGIGLGCQTSIVSLSGAQKITDLQFQGRAYAAFNTVTGCFGLFVFWVSTFFTTDQELRNIFVYQALVVISFIFVVICCSKKIN